jgi:hypothetical protein
LRGVLFCERASKCLCSRGGFERRSQCISADMHARSKRNENTTACIRVVETGERYAIIRIVKPRVRALSPRSAPPAGGGTTRGEVESLIDNAGEARLVGESQ